MQADHACTHTVFYMLPMHPWLLDVWWLHGRLLVPDPSGHGFLDPLARPAQRTQKALPLPPAAQAALDADPALTRAQAASWLGVASATLAEWGSAGKGPPYFQHGREVQYPLSGLVAWRQEQLRRPGVPDTPPPVKRPRGRPPGSKTKPRAGTAARRGAARRPVKKAPIKPKAKPKAAKPKARPRPSRLR
jgi:hypothetical protein